MKTIIPLALAAATATGCYKTTYHLQHATAPAVRSSIDGDFHVSLLSVVELSPAVDIAAACAGTAPVKLEEEVGALGSVVNFVLGEYVPVLQVRNASVDCAPR